MDGDGVVRVTVISLAMLMSLQKSKGLRKMMGNEMDDEMMQLMLTKLVNKNGSSMKLGDGDCPLHSLGDGDGDGDCDGLVVPPPSMMMSIVL